MSKPILDRGRKQVELISAAMLHELKDNHHKGHWLEAPIFEEVPTLSGPPTFKLIGQQARTLDDFATDAAYHLSKLVVAATRGDQQAVLEYAADVGNCSWFIADHMDALDQLHHEGPIEYDLEHIELWAALNRKDFRRLAEQFIADVLRAEKGEVRDPAF